MLSRTSARKWTANLFSTISPFPQKGLMNQLSGWIDIHTHLGMLKIPVEEAVAKAAAAGVNKMINIGTAPHDHQQVLSSAQAFQGQVYCTLGVHPEEVSLYSDEC